MNALLLTIVCLSQVTDDKVLAQLNTDFHDFVDLERDPTSIKKAAQLLSPAGMPPQRKDFSEALQLCRRSRSKAAIPLLLKQMLESDSPLQSDIEGYVDTLAILTGEDVANPWQPGGDNKKLVRTNVEKWVNSWWFPKKSEITTRLDKMSADQLRVVVDRLLRKINKTRTGYSEANDGKVPDITASALYHVMTYGVMQIGASPEPAAFWPEDLHAKMAPLLLVRVGHVSDRKAEVPLSKEIDFAAVELLGALRQNHGAAELEAIADDKKQNANCRLTAILSLYRAGEQLRTPSLLSILATEKRLDTRLITILALRYSRERDVVGPKLVELMDDPNDQVRTAAITSLAGPLPLAALPKLKQVVDNLEPSDAMVFVFGVIEKYQTPEARQILVDFLRAGLQDDRKTKHLSQALLALQHSTRQRWAQGGAHDNAYWKEKSQEAINWWNNNKPNIK